MSRLMYDSTDVHAIPADAEMVAAYVDGLYANVDDARRRFPHARIVTITVLGHVGADVADCERGDLRPESAARWAKGELHAGRKPTIYCLASQWGAVKAACHAEGVDPDHVSWWLADYDGDDAIPHGAVAKQYANPPKHGLGHFDLSAVRAHWVGVDPEPKAPAKPKRPAKPKVAVLRRGDKGDAVRAMQVLLNSKGLARLKADGDFGPATEAAVKHAQRAVHVAVDGVYGPKTAAAVHDHRKPEEPVLREGSRGGAVSRLQSLLRIHADGIFGPVTRQAVRHFQVRHGLKVDGVVGPKTWAALT